MRSVLVALTIALLAGCSAGGNTTANSTADTAGGNDVITDADTGGSTPTDTGTVVDGRSDTQSDTHHSDDTADAVGSNDTGTDADSADACACSEESRCCDGCQPRNEGEGCNNGEQLKPGICQNGACTDASENECECTNAGKACCDGCSWTPGKICATDQRKRCTRPDAECSPTVLTEERTKECNPQRDGSYECADFWSDWETTGRTRCTDPGACCEIENNKRQCS